MDILLCVVVFSVLVVILISIITCFVVWRVLASKSKSKDNGKRRKVRPLPPETQPTATAALPELIDTLRNLLDGAALREAESLAEESTDAGHIAAELEKRGASRHIRPRSCR
jgi:hypothetical protein